MPPPRRLLPGKRGSGLFKEINAIRRKPMRPRYLTVCRPPPVLSRKRRPRRIIAPGAWKACRNNRFYRHDRRRRLALHPGGGSCMESRCRRASRLAGALPRRRLSALAPALEMRTIRGMTEDFTQSTMRRQPLPHPFRGAVGTTSRALPAVADGVDYCLGCQHHEELLPRPVMAWSRQGMVWAIADVREFEHRPTIRSTIGSTTAPASLARSTTRCTRRRSSRASRCPPRAKVTTAASST